MLDTLLELPFALNRHRDAPLLEERLAFLRYLQERGTSHAALRNVSGQLLHVVDLLKLETLRDVSVDEIKQASRRWGERQRTNAPMFGRRATSSMWRRSGCASLAG